MSTKIKDEDLFKAADILNSHAKLGLTLKKKQKHALAVVLNKLETLDLDILIHEEGYKPLKRIVSVVIRSRSIPYDFLYRNLAIIKTLKHR